MEPATPTPVVGRLVSLDKDVERRGYLLLEDVYTIGRHPTSCEIVVRRPSVSRIHARIERLGSYYQLTNLSRQNTYLNGEPIAESRILSDQDEIGLDLPEPVFRYLDENQTVTPSQIHLIQTNPELATTLRFDERRMRFYLFGRPLALTPRELRLLHYLYSRRGEVCTREECEHAIWGKNPVVELNALHRVIADLRASFRVIDSSTEYIQTIRGRGYLLNL